MAELLLEIGLEEVPARMLAAAEAELGVRVLALLQRERLQDEAVQGGELPVQTYSTPRRLAVWVRGVSASQADLEEQLTGPAWGIAFKDGVATPAAHAFAKKAGVDVAALKPVKTAKGEYCSATVTRPGRAATEVLAELLPKEIAALSWPKPMYWRPGKPERFVRPLQWLVALLDDAVVPMEFAGVRAGCLSYGHRILHGDAPVVLEAPGRYEQQLHDAKVMVAVAERRHVIRKALDRVTRAVPGARWREDEALVETVTHLTEWPTVLLGDFASEQLALPEEVLVTVMRDHQKYFAVEDTQGKLAPHFLAVLNTEVDARGEAIIRHGNERVLRARFNDAQFFWSFDQKTPLADRVPLLEKVAFHKELGSYQQKKERTLAIARKLAALVQERGVTVDTAALEEAVQLAKVDLTTELVKEFTELQGIVGGLYVRHAARLADAGADATRHAEKVAEAIYWQYMPASISDAIPPTLEGQLLGLADRMGTIVDMFGIGLVPSGSKDPYALRRAANAVVKILAESGLPVDFYHILEASSPETSFINPPLTQVDKVNQLEQFFKERVAFYLEDVCKFTADVVDAVLGANLYGNLYTQRFASLLSMRNLIARAEALTKVKESPDIIAIAIASKRIKNILKQAGEAGEPFARQWRQELLKEPSELELFGIFKGHDSEYRRLQSSEVFEPMLKIIAAYRPYIDRFFEETMVMVDDLALRENRLTMLNELMRRFQSIADFSKLAPSAKQEA